MHRERKTPKPYNNYVALLCDIIYKEPSNYEEAAEKKKWKDAMIEENKLIMKNDVCEIVLKSEGKPIVTSKWIYKIKHATYGNIKRKKEMFLVCGFSQKESINYEETFAPVVRYTSIRTIVSFATVME